MNNLHNSWKIPSSHGRYFFNLKNLTVIKKLKIILNAKFAKNVKKLTMFYSSTGNYKYSIHGM